MKQIVLVRHATAVKRAPAGRDFDRALKKTGKKEAREMSKRLKELAVKPSLLMSSQADRALETAKVFAKTLGYASKKIDKREELYYELDPKGMLALIVGLDDKADSVVIFGHDPSLTGFARFLLPDFEEALPKAGVLGVKVSVDSWAKVTAARCEKEFFLVPSDRKAGKAFASELRRELGAKIEQNLVKTLAEFGIDGGDDVKEHVQEFSARLAKQLTRRVAIPAAPKSSEPPTSRRP